MLSTRALISMLVGMIQLDHVVVPERGCGTVGRLVRTRVGVDTSQPTEAATLVARLPVFLKVQSMQCRTGRG
jgi:hypothetical protein